MSTKHPTRREVIRSAVYVAPAIVSLAAMPSFAMAGSGGTTGRDKDKKDKDKPKKRSLMLDSFSNDG